MAIFSQTRADLYDFAGRQQRDKFANLSTSPDHLVTMLFERTGGKYLVTYGDIVDHLAPTFDEARQLGTLRVLTFNKVVEMFDNGEREIEKTSLATEIVDYLYDRLHLHRDAKTYDLLDIIGVIGPEITQVKKAASEFCENTGLDKIFEDFIERFPQIESHGTELKGIKSDDDDLDF